MGVEKRLHTCLIQATLLLVFALMAGCIIGGCTKQEIETQAVDENLIQAFSMSEADAVAQLHLSDRMKVDDEHGHENIHRYSAQYKWCGLSLDTVLSFNGNIDGGKPMHFHAEHNIPLDNNAGESIYGVVQQFSHQFDVFRHAGVSQENKEILSTDSLDENTIKKYIESFLDHDGKVTMEFRWQVPGTEMKDLCYAECIFSKNDGASAIGMTTQLLCYKV